MISNQEQTLLQWLHKNVKWKKWTYHHKTHLFFKTSTQWGRIYTYHGQDYLVNKEGEVGRIPYYVSVTLQGIERLTQAWGPYNFYNGFETTAEAEYLKKMFQYPMLTEVAQHKCEDILYTYGPWVKINQEFMKILNERERRLQNEKR